MLVLPGRQRGERAERGDRHGELAVQLEVAHVGAERLKALLDVRWLRAPLGFRQIEHARREIQEDHIESGFGEAPRYASRTSPELQNWTPDSTGLFKVERNVAVEALGRQVLLGPDVVRFGVETGPAVEGCPLGHLRSLASTG